MLILNGDLGGTKTLLELVKETPTGLQVMAKKRFASAEFGSFDHIIATFLEQQGRPEINVACFGVAGPVLLSPQGQQAKITNLPWHIDATALQTRFGFSTIHLVNDFEAVGHGVTRLAGDELVTLQTGEIDPTANQLVIGAGTGLGVAQIIPCDDSYRVLATEGGHAGFGPSNALQLELTGYLIKQQGNAASGSILSGQGLLNLYSFLHQRQAQSDDNFENIIRSVDPAAAITQAAQTDLDPLAIATLQLFVSCYGTQAGSYALMSLALGGVYIAGGIAPKIIDFMRQGEFIRAFNNKSKMSGLVQRMPVRVVMDPEVGLLGTRHLAATISRS